MVKRKSPPMIPTPADFAERAAELSIKALWLHYGLSRNVVRRMIEELPAPARAAHREVCRLARIAGGQAGGLTPKAPKPRRTYYIRPAPEGFFLLAMSMSRKALRKELRRSYVVVNRWIGELSQGQQRLVDEAAEALRLAANQAKAVKREMAAANPRPPRKRKASAKARVVHRAFKTSARNPEISSALHDRAVDHLKRWYVPAYNAGRVHGPDKAGRFMLGHREVGADELLAIAQARGFEADAWRKLAA